jgi:hypothetical protein
MVASLSLALVACARSDPWSACRGIGPAGFRAEPPACEGAACRACSAALGRAWSERADPTQRNALRARFMGVAADAREAFVIRASPDAPYPYEHCTASLARGATCAAWSPYCVDVVARGLRAGDTSLAERAQYDLAVSRACPATRAALATALTARCEGVAERAACDGPACVSCMAGHLAAMSVLAPAADHDDGARAMRAVVEATPEPVARAITEVLGAPDAPADLETVVVQRSLRAYCFALVARSASPPPYACSAVMSRFLSHDEYQDSPLAWASLARARPAVRGAVLDALLVEVVRGASVAASLSAQLRGLPREGTHEAVARAMRLPVTTDGAYIALREMLVRGGVTGAALPPVNLPSRAVSPARVAPAVPEPRSPANVGGMRAPRSIPAREG